MTDEPIFIADLLAKRNLSQIGVLMEQSPDRSELSDQPAKCVPPQRNPYRGGIRGGPDRAGTSMTRFGPCIEAKSEAIVHLGFGFGIVFINPALEALDWDPRFTTRRSRTPG